MVSMAEENSVEDDSPVVVQHGGSSLIKCKPLFTVDSKSLICGSGDLIKVYSVSSGECLQILQGHTAAVNTILFDPGNPYHLLSSADDGKIIKWNFEEGSIIKQYELGAPMRGLWCTNLPSTFYSVRQSSHDKWQLVKFSLPRTTPDKRIDAKMVLGQIEPEVNHVAIGRKNEFVASIFHKTLRIFKCKKQEKDIKLNCDKETKLTCVACHPVEETVVAGSKMGKIFFWSNVFGENVVRSFNHWHSLPVLDLAFTAQGSYLLSGGHECVLVKWQFNAHTKDTLPRLGAPLTQVTCSKDNTLYATCHSDNVIQIITNTLKVVQIIQGLTRRYIKQENSYFLTGLLLDPRSHALVTNGRPGHLQFYSLHYDKQLYNLDIVGQNYISPASLEKQLVLTELENVALSQDGRWMATVERRDDCITSPEIRLKFWLYDDNEQNYKLNTNVDLPHEARVSSLKFRNENENSDLMLVSTSQDGKFKLWQLIDDTDIYRTNQRWNCESAGFYRSYKAGPADFSEDGSLLAVGFENHLTLWDPDTNALRLTLEQRSGNISHLSFGSGNCSHLLVCATKKGVLTVWNMLCCSAEWSLDVRVTALAMDRLSDHVAVFTEDGELLVFKPNSNKVIHRQINVSKKFVTSAVFVPRSNSNNDALPWERLSQLYFVDEDQNLMTVKSKSEVQSGIRKQSQKIAENLPQTAFSLLMINERKKIAGSGDDRQLGNPGAKYLKEMLNTPAHVMPGVSSLCMSFMDTLLIKDTVSNGSAAEAEDEESDEEEEEKMEGGSDSESDMEVDAEKEENEEKENAESESETDRLSQYDAIKIDKLKGLLGKT